MKPRKQIVAAAVVLVLALLPCSVRADLYGFENITSNSVADAATGEAQLFVDVTDAGSGLVLFTFINTGPLASSITDVYFDDGTLLGLSGLVDRDDDDLVAGTFGDSGVDFSPLVSPPNLPGHNDVSPSFVVTAGFLADSDSPNLMANGVNPGETLGVLFGLQGGGIFDDIISELGTGELRIGIHFQGFDGGGSESFINPPTVIPAPAAAILGMIGLGVVGIVRKKT